MTTVAEVEALARKGFPVIILMLEAAGAQWSANVNGACGKPTIVIRVKSDRGFGLIFESETCLRGMGNHKYRTDDLADERQQDDFLIELKRRLSVSGASKREIMDDPANAKKCSWKGYRDAAKTPGKRFHEQCY